jgi:glycosyltransferase involved in cell wall biosynthesis
MRIALIAPLVSPIAPPYLGGAQALLADLAAGLARRGHQVTLFAASGSAIPAVTVRDLGIDSSQLTPARFDGPPPPGTVAGATNLPDPSFFPSAHAFLRVFSQLQQEVDNFDLVHAHAFDWPAFAYGALIAAQRPMLHTLHLPAVSPSINAVLRELHQMGNPTRLLTVSRACANTYVPYAPMHAIIPNGIDTDAIPFGPTADPEGFLLFAGRITPEKGVVEAIEIARRAGKRLLLAGGIYDAAYMNERVRPLLTGNVEYLGLRQQADLWRLMSRASALLFPIGWDEPFGLVAAEALAAGCPVIAFARGALPEILTEGETGFLIPPGNLDAAARAVARVPALSRAVCRARAVQHFSQARMLDEYERVYQEVQQKM